MKTFCFNSIVLGAFALLAGCSTSRQSPAAERTTAAVPEAPPAVVIDTALPAPEDPVPAVEERTWKPKFIPTGFASGVMLEFTGMKKDATLHAHFASLEFLPQPGGTNADLQKTIQEPATRMTATINDLRQAFFKVSPGIYHIRQTKDWAEQTLIKNVEVRDGSYSVVQVAVKVPKPARPNEDTGMNVNR
jgi:hypothetical protein